MAGPSEIVPLEDASTAAPEHAETRPLLPKLDGAFGAIRSATDDQEAGDGADSSARYRPMPPPLEIIPLGVVSVVTADTEQVEALHEHLFAIPVPEPVVVPELVEVVPELVVVVPELELELVEVVPELVVAVVPELVVVVPELLLVVVPELVVVVPEPELVVPVVAGMGVGRTSSNGMR